MQANADICYVSYIAPTLVCVANVGYLAFLFVQQIYYQLHNSTEVFQRLRLPLLDAEKVNQVHSIQWLCWGPRNNPLQIHCLF